MTTLRIDETGVHADQGQWRGPEGLIDPGQLAALDAQATLCQEDIQGGELTFSVADTDPAHQEAPVRQAPHQQPWPDQGQGPDLGCQVAQGGGQVQVDGQALHGDLGVSVCRIAEADVAELKLRAPTPEPHGHGAEAGVEPGGRADLGRHSPAQAIRIGQNQAQGTQQQAATNSIAKA